MSTLDCRHCGATLKSLGARFCEFCGTEIEREGTPRMPTRDEELQTRFELMRAHSNLRLLMDSMPQMEAPSRNLGLLLMAPIMLAFLIFFITQASAMRAPIIFFIVPVVMLGAVGIGVFKTMSRTARYRSAPLDRRPAIVVDERVKVSGGGKNSSATTSYYATLEFEDGLRREFSVGSRLAGSIAQGDAGVAFLKHDHLAAFERLSV